MCCHVHTAIAITCACTVSDLVEASGIWRALRAVDGIGVVVMQVQGKVAACRVTKVEAIDIRIRGIRIRGVACRLR